MKVMLLAAGKGERMLPLTRHTPKPLLQAGGRSLIEHQLRRLAAAGYRDIVINHAWLGEQLEAALGDGSRLGVAIRFSRESEPLETAGGIIQALHLLGGDPFVVTNADIWTDFPYQTLRTALRDDMLVHLVLVPNPGHHAQGDFVPGAGGILRRRSADNEPALTFSGIGVYRPELFAGAEPGKQALLPFLEKAIDARRASWERFDGSWSDIGTPARLEALDRSLRAGN